MAVGAVLLTSAHTDAAFTDTDGDGFSDLTEEVVGSDPDDAASVPETFDLLDFDLIQICFDGIDNDGDGNTDADDAGCRDSDGSYPSDETELILGSDPENDESYPEDSRLSAVMFFQGFLLFATCADGIDNDGDGLTDTDDPGCAPIDADGDGFEDFVEKTLGSDWQDAASKPEHVTANPGSCGDGADNDGDGDVDSADTGCVISPNDDVVNAIVVDALPFFHTAKIVGATMEPEEPRSSCSYAGEERETVWYRFASIEDQPIVIDSGDSDFISAVSVWHEDPLGLVEADCHMLYPYSGFSDFSRFSFVASAGETYFIQVERFALGELDAFIDLGRLSFHMEAGSPPPNDDFASAQQIESLPFATSPVDTIAASTEPSEPNASCRFQGRPTNSVWYRFTPSSDTHILADTLGTNFGVTVGAYEGESLETLEQVACGTSLAFEATAGQTYYLQAAGYRCAGPSGSDGGAASFCFDNRAGQLDLRVEAVTLPSCPAPSFALADPVSDTKPHLDALGVIDISSVSLAFSETTVCVTVGVDGGVDQNRIWTNVDIDTDMDRDTGWRVSSRDFCGPLGLGGDFRAFAQGIDGLLVSIGGDEAGLDPERAYATYDESAFTILLPISRIGNDTTFRLTVETLYTLGGRSGSFSDCAPNGGNITCLEGVCAFAPFRNGDANCDGPADSIDAVLILQHDAGLLSDLACPDAADVNADGAIDTVDGALVLQFTAGLLKRLPPFSTFFSSTSAACCSTT